jgi:hypothetical protein
MHRLTAFSTSSGLAFKPEQAGQNKRKREVLFQTFKSTFMHAISTATFKRKDGKNKFTFDETLLLPPTMALLRDDVLDRGRTITAKPHHVKIDPVFPCQ